MCPNRVEALESRVQELEASVEGLTDELVECKVRLRELENAVDEDLGFTPSGPTSSDATADEPTESGDTSKSQADDTSDSAEEQSEIIVA